MLLSARATLVWALFLEIFGFHNEIKISISTIKFHYFMWIFEYFISTELSMAEQKSWICNSRDQCWTYSILVFFPTCSNFTSITFIKYTWQWCQQFLPLKRLSTPIPCEKKAQKRFCKEFQFHACMNWPNNKWRDQKGGILKRITFMQSERMKALPSYW